MPSKSTEAWVVALLFPNDVAVQQGIECYAHAEARLGQQSTGKRLRKKKRDYSDRAEQFVAEWSRIAAADSVTEAHRFQTEFLAATPPG